MNFTDIFIRRPVLATVLSLALVVLGLGAFADLSLREYPEITYPTITVTTLYPGASADLIQGSVTQPLLSEIASAEGIDYLESNSQQSVSTITANLYPDHDIDSTLLEISNKVAKLRGTLPAGIEDPIVEKGASFLDSVLFMAFSSPTLSDSQITEYVERVVLPQLNTLPGVSSAQVNGNREFAMRIWLDAQRMAVFGITAEDIQRVINSNNFPGIAGPIKAPYRFINVKPMTELATAEDFKSLIIKTDGGATVRLRDVATVELGPAQSDSMMTAGGKPAVLVTIGASLRANPLEVVDAAYERLALIKSQLPEGMQVKVSFDPTQSIRESIFEVVKTLVEASLIVMAVVFLFLGSLRTVAIPIVTIPLSLIGVATVIYGLGFSLNLLTLLAMVLAIGLVVDDAIVVVENVQRHLEEGEPPLRAATHGAREIAFPVIAMTFTLAAVYAPIGLIGGLTGALFTEFAFTLAGAVIISGIVALTLSPMMCAKLLTSEATHTPMASWIDRRFNTLQARYRSLLRIMLRARPLVLLFAVAVVGSVYFLYRSVAQELAPTEDNNVLLSVGTGPLNSTIEDTARNVPVLEALLQGIPEYDSSFAFAGINGTNSLVSFVMLQSAESRARGIEEIQGELVGRASLIPGMRFIAFPFTSVPGAEVDLPIKLVLSSTASHQLVYEVAEDLVRKAYGSGSFLYVDNALKYELPQVQLEIDREAAAQLGIPMSAISTVLGTFLSESDSGSFTLGNNSYDLILQVNRGQRDLVADLASYHVNTASGTTVPLSTLVTLERSVVPNSLAQHQQMNSTTISALMAPGVSIAEGIATFERLAAETLPDGFRYDFLGKSRQFLQEGNKLLYAFLFSFLMIYLVLAAQFESFSDPIVVLVGVPLSVFGGLLPLVLGQATVNIYTQIGLLTLIGLISKHGILIVDFANKLRESKGLDVLSAVEEAAAVRLRPILMTTAAMVFGVVPLLLATGSGSAARFSIGVVIFFGMAIGTLFTLFVLPAVYTLLARRTRENPVDTAAVMHDPA